MSLADVVIPQPHGARGGELTAFLGVPDGPGSFVPLVVVRELFGIDHDVVEYPEAGHAFLNAAPNGAARLHHDGAEVAAGLPARRG